MAGPLRFRRSNEAWSERRVRRALLRPLDDRFGATLGETRAPAPDRFSSVRIDMDNGDFALFAWYNEDGERPAAYWLGNTETPETLWRTDKVGWDDAPYGVARWAQRELLADLTDQDPWLAAHEHLAWYFLPVFFSKDGRESTRSFFRDYAAGFPDGDRERVLSFYESLFASGDLDPFREVMAGKLGTSPQVDVVRMGAAMAEFHAAKLLAESGNEFVPEIDLDSGHALDFVVGEGVRDTPRRSLPRRGDTLVEVTRPRPPSHRVADTPIAALKATASAKTDDQLDAHPNALLCIDCSSFQDDQWNAIRAEKPPVAHTPAIVYRMRPNGSVEAYRHGDSPVDLSGAVRWV
ncbi:DUF5784 family protein [Halomarina rubra]|uniref:DUF5784 family protein n=1 Tax=Halomarina rubra TaxID=2071873 RepID=A0ABD6AVZ2_9EURY